MLFYLSQSGHQRWQGTKATKLHQPGPLPRGGVRGRMANCAREIITGGGGVAAAGHRRLAALGKADRGYQLTSYRLHKSEVFIESRTRLKGGCNPYFSILAGSSKSVTLEPWARPLLSCSRRRSCELTGFMMHAASDRSQSKNYQFSFDIFILSQRTYAN